jgi:GNAT superfamily N-acetyltransferase
MLKTAPSDGIDLEARGLNLDENVLLTLEENEVFSMKLQILDASGKQISIIAVRRDTIGNYNIVDRKTHLDFRGQGLGSLLLEKAEKHISDNLSNGPAELYLEVSQESVLSWAEKNGFIPETPINRSEMEISYEQDGDTFYIDRHRLSKTIGPAETRTEVDDVRANLF